MDEAQLRELTAANPELGGLRDQALAAIAAAGEQAAIEDVRVRFLGRKSRLTEILRSISALPAEQRPVVGRLGNLVRVELGALVEAGAVVQLTAGSLTGQFGPGALRAAEHFLRVGIAQLVASDAHSTDVRPPGLGKAREKVRWLGEEAVHGIFEANPAAVLVGGDLPWGGRA